MKTNKKIHLLLVLPLLLISFALAANRASAAEAPSLSLPGSSVVLAATSTTAIVFSAGDTLNFPINGTGGYYIASSTDSSIATAYISGSNLSVSGIAIGHTSLTFCQNDGQCSNYNFQVLGAPPLHWNNTHLSLTVGGSNSVPLTGGGGYYISSNSDSGVASAYISGSAIYVSALSAGETDIRICQCNRLCSDLFVDVTAPYVPPLAFSPNNNPQLLVGESTNIYLSGNGGYYISNNSNPNVAAASVNGSNFYISAIGIGYSTITVCQNGGQCLSIQVNVFENILTTFSPNSLNITVGSSSTAYIGGAIYNGFYVSGNSNPNVAGASINNMNNSYKAVITGLSVGSTNISICSKSINCGYLPVNVTAAPNYRPFTFTPSTLYLGVGKSGSVIINGFIPFGGNGFYVSNITNPNVAAAAVNGFSINISGLNIGNTDVTVCQPGGQCNTFNVSVIAAALTPDNLILSAGGTGNVTLTGNGSYYISNSSNPSVANAYINGSQVIVSAGIAGSTDISVCQYDGPCSNLHVGVTAANSPSVSNPIIKNLIKLANHPGVYLLVSGEKRLFSNRAVYSNWYGNDFSGLRTITQAEFDSITYGKNLTIKTGSYFKFDNSENVYLAKEGNTICKTNNYTGATYLIQSSFIGDYQGFGNCQ